MTDVKTAKDTRASQLIQLFVGWFMYPAGDLLGQLLMGQFSFSRMIVLTLVGGVIYKWEIPRWFSHIEKQNFKAQTIDKYKVLKPFTQTLENGQIKFNWIGKTLCASLYFNPIWIFRHLLFILLAITPLTALVFPDFLTSTLIIATISFFTNLPITVVGNYLIQEHLSLKYRFMGSALLTTVLNIKYAIEFVYFS